jgi:PKD repeat protein
MAVYCTSDKRTRGFAQSGLARLIVALSFLALGFPTFSREHGMESFRSDRILVQLKPGIPEQALQRMHRQEKNRLLHRTPGAEPAHVLALPAGRTVHEALARYRQSGLVAVAEPDYIVRAVTLLSPNDPKFQDGTLWGLHNTGQSGGRDDADIDAPEGWMTAHSASNIIVAVVDSGIRYTHEDLAANLWINPGEIAGNGIDDDDNGIIDDLHGFNAATDSGDPSDAMGHGTHVAGIIGAVGNNSKGVVGVAWNVRLMALRFLDGAGNGSISDAIRCIDYARTNGASVINASWGGSTHSSFLEAAIRRARDAGIIFVAAAGNDSMNIDATPFYPASYNLNNIVSVTGTTRTDALGTYASYGATSVDLAAPGTSIYSTGRSSDSSYTWNSGTSMAAAYVSGVFALMKVRYPNDTHLQLIDRVLSSVDPVPALAGKCVTGGRVNLHKALGPAIAADFTATPAGGDIPLEVQFTDTSAGEPVFWQWDFGDGSPLSTEQHPSHLFTQEGNFTVTLTASTEGGTASQKSQVISAIANYAMEPAIYDWVDPAEMAALSLEPNGVSLVQALPFPFIFYGQSYDQLHVSGNGLLGFLQEGLENSSNVDIPNPNAPHAIIAPWWDDLDPSAGGTIRMGMGGEAPDRRLVVSWENVPHRSNPPAAFTFQAVLFERSHRIVFQYQEVQESLAQGAGRRATVGIENETGLAAKKFSFNGSTPLTNHQAILFIPRSTGGIAVTPSAAFHSTGDAGGEFSPALQVYTIVNTTGDDLNWSVAISGEWLSLSATNGILAPQAGTNILISLNAAAQKLPAGAHHAAISFVNHANGIGNTVRLATLIVTGLTSLLEIDPEADLVSSGFAGGPFTPASRVYTLLNSGDATLEWTAETDVDWITLSSHSGMLAAGDSTSITVLINAEASFLAPGTNTASVAFANLTQATGNTSRTISLNVGWQPPHLTVSRASDPPGWRVEILGEPDQVFILQTSPDMTTWETIHSENSGPGGLMEFFESDSAGRSSRFYRAIQSLP